MGTTGITSVSGCDISKQKEKSLILLIQIGVLIFVCFGSIQLLGYTLPHVLLTVLGTQVSGQDIGQ